MLSFYAGALYFLHHPIKLSPYTPFNGPLPALANPSIPEPCTLFHTVYPLHTLYFPFNIVYPYGGSLNTLNYFPCDGPALPLPSLLCWSPVIPVISPLYRCAVKFFYFIILSPEKGFQ
jgi:hypothetical protein